MANLQPAIDRLPESERKKVLDALIAGETLESIAKRTGISRNAIGRYKRNHLVPALRAATYSPIPDGLTRDSNSQITHRGAIAKEIIRTTPFRERLQSMWERAERVMNQAEAAVRVGTNEDGETVFGSQDLSVLAPLMNQAHKNLEMLGKLTGELDQERQGPSIAIQIVCPAGGQTPRVVANPADDGAVIEVSGVEIGVKSRNSDAR